MNTCWTRQIFYMVLSFAIWGIVRPASADLYTSIQPSLEWLVDSSDAIYLAQVGPMRGIEDKNAVLYWDPHKLINARGPLSSIVRDQHLQKKGEWLFFMRSGPRGWQIIRAVDLSHPRARSSTSAITEAGDVLASRGDILNAVDNRVNKERFLPAGANPDEFDLMFLPSIRSKGEDSFPAVVQRRLGGYLRYQTIGVWDKAIPTDDGVEEADMLVTGLIVPADRPNRDYLVDKLRSQLGGEDSEVHYKWDELQNDLWALVNYRDDEVIKLLERYEQLGRDNKLGGSSSQFAFQTETIRRYWRFVDSCADPANRAVPGRWELQVRPTELQSSPQHPRFWVDLRVTPDQRFTAICYRIAYQGREAEICRHSTGYWLVEGGKMLMEETQIQSQVGAQPDLWRQYLKVEGPLDREKMTGILSTLDNRLQVVRRISDLPLALTAD